MNEIVGGIVGLISCLLCAVPFMIIARFDKGSSTPISFWAGDRGLKEKVINIPEYNVKMSKLFYECGTVFIICGVICLFSLIAGIILICLACTGGLYLAYRRYRKILNEFS